VTTAPTIELSEAFLRDTGPVYEQLRSRGSVHHVRFPTGLTGWLVTDYNLAKQVLGDPTIRKDVHHFRRIVATAHPGLNLPGALRSDMTSHMLNTDPPDHTRLRRLVAQAFTPRSVTALEPRIAQIAEDLLAGMPTQGPVDLLAEFAFPLPITVICDLLGVPAENREQFRSWTNAILFSGAAAQGAVQASGDLDTYLRTLISTRRQHPQQDMLSRLTTADEDGAALSDTEILATAFLLLIAGHETTVNLIGNTMLTLLTAQDRYKRLRERPEQLPAALGEHLRHLGPVHIATIRFTTEPRRGRVRLRVPGCRQRRPAPLRSPRARRLRPRQPRSPRIRARHPRLPRRPLGPRRRRHRLTRLLTHYPHMRLAADPGRARMANQHPHPRPGHLARATALTRHRSGRTPRDGRRGAALSPTARRATGLPGSSLYSCAENNGR